MENEIMTTKQVANFLQISAIQAFRFMNRSFNPIPTNRISDKTVRVLKKELLQWVEYSCPECSHEMQSVIENTGFDEPSGPSHYSPSGKLRCPNCEAIK